MEVENEPGKESKGGKWGCIVILIVIVIFIGLAFIASMDYPIR